MAGSPYQSSITKYYIVPHLCILPEYNLSGNMFQRQHVMQKGI